MDKSVLHSPQRQSIVGTLFELIRSFRQLFKMFWPILLLYVFKGDNSKLFEGYWWLVGIVLLLFFVVNAILSWRNFYFYIKDNQLILQQGYLKKWTTAIPFSKIVSVNIRQGVIHQLFDIVQLEIDSAGSKNKEIQIKALSREMAELLQQEMMLVVDYRNDTERIRQSDNKVLHLNILDLLRIGIAQNHLKGFLLLLVFGSNIYQELKDIFTKELAEIGTKATSYLDNSSIYFQLVFVAFLLLLGIFISIVNIILRYYDLTVTQHLKTFTIQQGLFTKKQITIPFTKVQVVKNSISPVQRWLGISSVQIVQINSSADQKEKEKVFIHGCNHKQYLHFCNTVFQHPFDNDYEVIRPHKRFTLRNFSIIFIMMSVAIAVGSYLNLMLLALLPLAFVFAFVIAKLITKKRSYAIGNQYLYVNGGVIAQTQAVTKIEKIQAIRIKQTFFQRKKGVASLNIYVAGDNLNINYIDRQKAIAIKDNLLYKCEKS